MFIAASIAVAAMAIDSTADLVWSGQISARVVEIEKESRGISALVLSGSDSTYRVRLEISNDSKREVDVASLPAVYAFMSDDTRGVGIPYLKSDPREDDRPFSPAKPGRRSIASGASWTGNFFIALPEVTSDNAKIKRLAWRYSRANEKLLDIRLP
jgi:hypothetical protein